MQANEDDLEDGLASQLESIQAGLGKGAVLRIIETVRQTMAPLISCSQFLSPEHGDITRHAQAQGALNASTAFVAAAAVVPHWPDSDVYTDWPRLACALH